MEVYDGSDFYVLDEDLLKFETSSPNPGNEAPNDLHLIYVRIMA